VQSLANSYGVPFPECPGSSTNNPSLIRARPNATVADVRTQIDDFLLADAFTGKDLVTILVGVHDVLALNEQISAASISVDAAVAQAEALGTEAANQVNRVARAGGKVIIATIPDQSLTPFGRADATRAGALHLLSERFNSRLRVGLINDGRMIGLVLLDETMQAIANSTGYNSTDPACNDATIADVRTCNSQTLRTKDGAVASPATWAWADNLRMSPLVQNSLASVAITRANNNPF
jgi:phospholipase/lecithinase/hemolysin